ncbi:MAK10-like protein [Tanacetum coccineum]|uniref:MAK10-like protein n=1 Tax=Tanacetum coccineum TaxID=301880 RepID=A0ABQ5BQ98_9ASTR
MRHGRGLRDVTTALSCIYARDSSGNPSMNNIHTCKCRLICNWGLSRKVGLRNLNFISDSVPNYPQPQALETVFEARVRDYMAAHTKRMKRFKNAIFKQREEINDRMAEMFGLLKELTASKTLEKVLVREEARHPITKHVNSISLIRMEEEKNVKNNMVVGKNIVELNKSIEAETLEEVDKDDEVDNRTNIEPVKSAEKDLTGEKVIELLETPRFIYSLLAMKSGGLQYIDAFVDQGSDVNVMPLFTYNRLTDEKLIKTDIRLSLASQSHIYPLGMAEDVLVEIASFIYPVDVVILNIKEDRKRPFILGMPFMKTAKAKFRFGKGAITLKSGKSKTNFLKTPEYFCKFKETEKDEIDPITPKSIVSKQILEWEERIKFRQEKELEFNQ